MYCVYVHQCAMNVVVLVTCVCNVCTRDDICAIVYVNKKIFFFDSNSCALEWMIINSSLKKFSLSLSLLIWEEKKCNNSVNNMLNEMYEFFLFTSHNCFAFQFYRFDRIYRCKMIELNNYFFSCCFQFVFQVIQSPTTCSSILHNI